MMDSSTPPPSDPSSVNGHDPGSGGSVRPDGPAVIWVATDDGGDSAGRLRRRRGRRPARQPLTTADLARSALSAMGVVSAMVFIWLQLQPSQLLRDTLTSGGDMGAHVWGPDYLRREVLPHLSLSGWAKDWYAGFPAYKFYMVVPALLVLLVQALPFVGYGVAFKLVTVAGLVTMPAAAFFMGRMFRMPYPGPVVLAFGTLPFIFDFDERFRIIGGNAASTLAGEFSFSISLTICLLYLGVVARGLETGRYRAWGAVLFALVMLNHLIPAMFAVVATVLLGLWRLAMDARKPASAVALVGFVGSVVGAAWGGFSGAFPVTVAVVLPVVGVGLLMLVAAEFEPAWRATLLWVAPAGILGAFVTGFWSLPFVRNHTYFNDMGWERLQNYRDNLAPAHSLTMVWYVVFMLCVIGVVLSIVERQLIGGFLASSALTMGLLFATWPDSQMWNARFLPFYYLSLYLLAAVGLALFIGILPTLALRSVGAFVGAMGMIFVAGLPLGIVPGSQLEDGQWSFLGLFDAPPSFVDDWARWNYSGYQGKPKWPEYKSIIDAMAEIGEERGCGRAMWEYQTETLNAYGTPMALMLLPYWTKGCIGSMEGLYFESSATTPYHFMNQSEMSAAPSRAQRDLPYGALDVARGVQHLQLLGVRYYMALSDSAKSQADDVADLSYIRDVGPWSIYEVTDSELVEALPNEPAVLTDVDEHQADWLEPSADYYNDPDRWTVPLAATGPRYWQRVEFDDEPEQRALPTVEVSEIVEGSDRISFDVSDVGVPVLVKTSYFPNWKVDGAKGPYRVMPNLMVVVPTDNHVELHYGRTATDWAGIAMSVIGIAGVVALAMAAPLELRRTPRRRRAVLTAADLDVSRYQLVFPDETGGLAGAEPLVVFGGEAAPAPWPDLPGDGGFEAVEPAWSADVWQPDGAADASGAAESPDAVLPEVSATMLSGGGLSGGGLSGGGPSGPSLGGPVSFEDAEDTAGDEAPPDGGDTAGGDTAGGEVTGQDVAGPGPTGEGAEPGAATGVDRTS